MASYWGGELCDFEDAPVVSVNADVESVGELSKEMTRRGYDLQHVSQERHRDDGVDNFYYVYRTIWKRKVAA